MHTCQYARTVKKICAFEAFREAIRGEAKTDEPCQTLEYKVDVSKISQLPKNRIQYSLWFQYPAQVHVKEEYLIYDTVTFISSIGGTVGVCIGLSMYTLAQGLWTWLQIGIKRILPKKQRKTHQNPWMISHRLIHHAGCCAILKNSKSSKSQQRLNPKIKVLAKTW